MFGRGRNLLKLSQDVKRRCRVFMFTSVTTEGLRNEEILDNAKKEKVMKERDVVN